MLVKVEECHTREVVDGRVCCGGRGEVVGRQAFYALWCVPAAHAARLRECLSLRPPFTNSHAQRAATLLNTNFLEPEKLAEDALTCAVLVVLIL
jgi:hypothetical protein